MTERRAGSDERAQTFLEAYESHDTAQAFLEQKLHRHGYTVEEMGIDKRHEDIDDPSVIPDLRVSRHGQVRGYLEPKSKSAEYANWFGRLNYRHFKEYCEFAEDMERPVILYFAVVDDSMHGSPVVREGFCPVVDENQIVDRMVPNSNPNTVVELDERDFHSWPWLINTLET